MKTFRPNQAHDCLEKKETLPNILTVTLYGTLWYKLLLKWLGNYISYHVISLIVIDLFCPDTMLENEKKEDSKVKMFCVMDPRSEHNRVRLLHSDTIPR